MTDIEWVEESDWDAVGVGQRVTLKNDDGIVSFKILRHHRTRDCIHIFSNGHSYSEWDWTLYVEAKPAVELPTEFGLYRLDNGMVIELCGTGWWAPNSSRRVMRFAKESATFTRLEPVAETAKKVLDWAWAHGLSLGAIQDGRKKFGVPE